VQSNSRAEVDGRRTSASRSSQTAAGVCNLDGRWWAAGGGMEASGGCKKSEYQRNISSLKDTAAARRYERKWKKAVSEENDHSSVKAWPAEKKISEEENIISIIEENSAEACEN